MQKKVGLVAVLILLCGVSAYMWMSNSELETDTAIAKKTETWKCPACEEQFQLTVAEVTAMLRTARHDIVCPKCGEGGAEREGEILSMSGGLPTGRGGDGDDQSADEEEEEQAPPRPKGTMGPVERP
jgi:ribosomal protein L37AE/L43A